LNNSLKSKKANTIQGLFDNVAKFYDIGNDLITLGRHRRWKKSLVKLSNYKNAEFVLDCATGTGDLVFLFDKYCTSKTQKIWGYDFSQKMLDKAIEKNKPPSNRISFSKQDIQVMPISNNSVDIITISYGIRNVESLQKVIQEFYRILRPGGELLILETGIPDGPVYYGYKFFSRLLGVIGRILGNKDSYVYLQESALEFPCANNFTSKVQEYASFELIGIKKLLFGASYIYHFRK
jgi:demethylmenaquinone methyltransferase / 2-methoxy-6-polyprenyl-1,4-benzoquinol methylase